MFSNIMILASFGVEKEKKVTLIIRVRLMQGFEEALEGRTLLKFGLSVPKSVS